MPRPAHRLRQRAGGMMSSGDRRLSTSERRSRARPWPARRARRVLAGLACAGLAASGLAACGTANASNGPAELTLYQYPDNSGATQHAIQVCEKQSGGKYTISYQQLPNAADGQRLQLVRRLAANDSTIDIMGLDVTREAEFAEAGWIEPWTGANRTEAENGTPKAALDTATWTGQPYA